MPVEEDWPEGEAVVVTGHGLDLIETISMGSDVFVLVAGQRPELPALEGRAMAEVEEGIQVIVGHYGSLASPRVCGEHDIRDFVAEQAVSQVAIKGPVCRVVLAGVRGALIEEEWKESETVADLFVLGWAAGETEYLTELPAVLASIPEVGHGRIEKPEFARIGVWVARGPEQGGQGPSLTGSLPLLIVERAGGLDPLAGCEGEAELVEEGTGMKGVLGQTAKGQHEAKRLR
jgi:hypothetical protein